MGSKHRAANLPWYTLGHSSSSSKLTECLYGNWSLASGDGSVCKHKREDLRTDTQNLSQKRSVAEHTHNPSAVEAKIGESLRLTGQLVQLNQ